MSQSWSLDSHLETAYASGDLGKALQLAEGMLAETPRHGLANLVLARIRMKQGLYLDALDAATIADEVSSGDAATLGLLAEVHAAIGDSEAAILACDRWDSVTGGAQASAMTRARIMERAGDWEGGIAALDRLGGIPDFDRMLLRARCELRGGRAEDSIETLDRASGIWGIDLPNNARIKARIHRLRAKALDQAGRYDEAFDSGKLANDLESGPFDQPAFESQFDGLIDAFSADRIASAPGRGGAVGEHVFIVGMPRSGTTLVEQILDAHPNGVGIGEFREFDIQARRLQQETGSWAPWPACVSSLKPDAAIDMARAYEAAIRRHGYPEGMTSVNKNLLNPRLAGLIAMVLPNARFVLVHREPLDLAISCFLGAFSSRVHPELSTLEGIAASLRGHRRLLQHWKEVLGDRCSEVDYESLVGDPGRRIRELIEGTGLPWDERCLRFFESGRTVMTLSYDQVSRPVYDSSVGRCRNYERQLAPLAQLLAD